MRTPARLAALAAVLVLTGCGAPDTGSPVAAPTAAPSAAPTSAPAPATTTASRPSPSGPGTTSGPTRTTPAPAEVPDTLRFTSTTVDGQAFDGASLAGKPVLLWFWAPWCPTCRSQVDDVQAITRDFAGQVAVVGVGSLDDSDAIERFAADVPGPVHLDDESGAVFRHFAVVQQSSFVLLDAAGRKVWSVGYGGSDDLAEQVAAVAG